MADLEFAAIGDVDGRPVNPEVFVRPRSVDAERPVIDGALGCSGIAGLNEAVSGFGTGRHCRTRPETARQIDEEVCLFSGDARRVVGGSEGHIGVEVGSPGPEGRETVAIFERASSVRIVRPNGGGQTRIERARIAHRAQEGVVKRGAEILDRREVLASIFQGNVKAFTTGEGLQFAIRAVLAAQGEAAAALVATADGDVEGCEAPVAAVQRLGPDLSRVLGGLNVAACGQLFADAATIEAGDDWIVFLIVDPAVLTRRADACGEVEFIHARRQQGGVGEEVETDDLTGA